MLLNPIKFFIFLNNNLKIKNLSIKNNMKMIEVNGNIHYLFLILSK